MKTGYCNSCGLTAQVNDAGGKAGGALAGLVATAFFPPLWWLLVPLGALGGHLIEQNVKVVCPQCQVPLQILDILA